MREQVYRQVLESIVTGQITPGTRVKDTDIAGQLGISRTPVRETLLRLEQEGFLESNLCRGFKVRTLQLREVEEVYPILWTLESLALKSSEPPSPSRIEKMTSLNEKIAQCIDAPVRLIEWDNAWHAALVSGCNNEWLLSMIGHLKTVIRRYEYKYMHQVELVDKSVGDHGRLIEFLKTDKIDAAGALLEEHWRRSMHATARELGE